jgi:hypothetical protein
VAPPDLRMVVEGQDLIERAEDGTTSPICMGADGIAIAADGSRLHQLLPDGRPALVQRLGSPQASGGTWETVVHDPRRRGPAAHACVLFRTLIGAGPVRLR